MEWVIYVMFFCWFGIHTYPHRSRYVRSNQLCLRSRARICLVDYGLVVYAQHQLASDLTKARASAEQLAMMLLAQMSKENVCLLRWEVV
ncbi:hypothetical protein BD311DRAFT_558560 [Dichomitus squalens]|uniref:Uncharacterized protein n=1 Tax=Dichomitus squalens TaxID=114155 RepID=A0A4Q9MBK0_9APHY|nr:hypothetical protein BD311DRAFT_558560 [Dichomitus squalens]